MVIPALHAQISHRFRGDAVPRGAVVTYGVGFGGVPLPNDLAADCHDLFAARFLPLLGPSIALDETIARLGPSPNGPSGSWSVDVLGGNSGGQVTPNVALLFKKRTNVGGRKHRGRFYLPGIIEAAVDAGGHLAGDAPTDFQAAATQFLSGLATAGLPMVVLHSDATDPTPVIALVVDNTAATQRRRLRG